MSVEAFPTFLPNPTRDFNGKVDTSVLRTPMESGRIRKRRRFTSNMRAMPVVWEFTDWEFGMFQSWHENKISSGADEFTISLPTGGEGFKTVTATFFDGDYSFAHIGILNWKVSAILEVEDSLVWDESTYDAKVITGPP